MKLSPFDFLKKYYGCNLKETDSINYKPYEYGMKIETITVIEAIKKIKEDVEDMENILSFYTNDYKEKAIKAVYKIWEKHLIIFK